MWLILLAWKNMWRNRSRTVITMAAIFFAVILSVLASSLQEGVFNNLVKNVVSFYTGYIQVHKQGYWNEQILDNSFEASAAAEKRILQTGTIAAVTARLEAFALVSSQDITKGSLVVGIEPEKENRVTFLKNKLTAGSYLTDRDPGVLIASGLADRLKLKVADTLVLIGQGYHGATAAGKYPVRGIVKFGSPDLNGRSLFMPLAAAQELYSAYGMVTSYVLSPENTADLQSAAIPLRAALGPEYEVMTWEELIPDVKQHIEADTNTMKYILAILYMLICFGIFGTLLMMMVERQYEMGMLIAIGMKKTRLMGLLLMELVCTVLAGCVLGILVSVPLVYYLNRYPLRLGGETAKAYERFGFEPIFPTAVNSSNFIDQGIIVLIIGCVLSLYPMYKVWRTDPVTAMKR